MEATVPSQRMKMADVPANPRRARPGAVKVFTVVIVFIDDDGQATAD